MAAYEADKVVVSLIADNAQFDAATKASAANYQQGMNQIAAAGAGAEKTNARLTLAVNQNRIAMMEWQHIGRGFSDQLAAGGSLTQAFSQHIGMMGEALALSAQSAGKTEGAFAKFAGFLGTGWGIAATFALVGIIKLIQAHKSEGDALDEALDKLKKHAAQTVASEEADRIWANTIDGLIDRQRKLNDELDKRLETQTAIDRAQLAGARADVVTSESAVKAAEKRLADLKAQLASETPVTGTGPGAEARAGEQAARIADLNKQIAAAQKALTEAQTGLDKAQRSVTEGMLAAGKAQADLAGQAKAFGEIMDHNNKVFFDADPAMAGFSQSVSAATSSLAKAAQDAASAGVDFTDVEHQYDALRKKFNQTGDVKTYTTEIQKLAKALEATADAAKKAASVDPVKQFKASVIGAEGTGANKLGSSAAGFGQFMPNTWLSYFNQLFPDKADLSDAAKLAYRNVRSVAEAVIDKATDDYVKVITKAGQSVTAANLYAVHVLGARDASKLFAAAPGTPTSAYLSSAVLKGNPFLQGTTADARAALGKRIGDSSGAASSAVTAMQQLADKQLQSNLDFAKKSDDLDAKIIDARDGQVQDELVRADLSEQRIRAEQKTLDAAIDEDAQAKKNAGLDVATADAQAAILHEKNAALTNEKIATVELQKQAEIAKRVHDAADQQYQFATEDLQSAQQLATSQQQRRAIELELIDLKYQQKVADLEYLKLQAERNNNQDQANLIQGQIDHLPYEKAADVTRTQLDTMGPWHQFLKDIPHDAKAANEAVQSLAVDGVHSLVDGLGQASVAWIKMGGLAGQVIKDLISKVVDLILYQQIAHLFGGGGIQNPFGNNIVNLGADIPLNTPSTVDIPLPHLAGGGSGKIRGFGGTDNNMLALNGQPIAWVNQGEELSISPANATAARAGGTVLQPIVNVYANDAVLAETVRGWVTQGVATAIQGGSQGGAALARDNLAKRSLHQLER